MLVGVPFSLSFPDRYSFLKEHIWYMYSWFTRTPDAQRQGTSHQELEKTSELLRSCNSLGPRLFLVLVRIVPVHSIPPWGRERGNLCLQNRFSWNFLLDFSLGGDFMAGLTVACLLIPQSVSYGTSLAKLGPTAGLVCHELHFSPLSHCTHIP